MYEKDFPYIWDSLVLPVCIYKTVICGMLRNIFTISAGTVISQIIMLLATPVLTRRYEMEAFGYFAGAVSIALIVSTIACLRYETAILINKQHGDAESLLVVCLCLLTLVCLISFLVGQFLISTKIKDFLLPHNQSILPIVLCIFVTSFGVVVTNWHAKHQRFKIVSAAMPVRAIGIVLSQYLIYPAFKINGLLFGYIGGYALYGILLFSLLVVFDYIEIHKVVSLESINRVLREHKNFPLFGIWGALLNTLVNNLPNLLFVKIYSPILAGAYSMSNRLVKAPLALVGQSISRVTGQYVGQHACNKNEIQRVTTKVYIKMAHIAGLPFAIMSIVVKPVMIFVLGESWEIAGTYCRHLAPWLFLIYLTWPLTAVYNTLNQQKMILFFNILFLLSVLIAFSLSIFDYSGMLVVISLSILGSISRFLYAYWILKELNKEKVYSTLKPTIFYYILIALAAYFPLLESLIR